MPNKNKSEKRTGGLCDTCNNAPGCTLCISSKDMVWDCEEYEDTVPLPTKNAFDGSVLNRGTVFSGVVGADEAGKYRGLCIDCENRTMCTFEKADGGIWHCEDYR